LEAERQALMMKQLLLVCQFLHGMEIIGLEQTIEVVYKNKKN
jgi:hypothetical protein